MARLLTKAISGGSPGGAFGRPLQLTINESKAFFFDRQGIQRKINAARREQRLLRRAGYLIRQTGRQSMRKVKKRSTVSAVGTPPRAHSREPNLRTIFFIYDPSSVSMVVGPPKLPNRNLASDPLPVPGLHEHGASVTRYLVTYSDGTKEMRNSPVFRRGVSSSNKSRKKKNFNLPKRRRRVASQKKQIRLRPRPFMRPALEANLDKIPPLWRDSVK